MAKYKGDIKMTGSLGDFSFVNRSDLKESYVRTKGGASKEKVKNSPSMANTRRVNMEFGGCSKAGTAVRKTINSLRHLADYNISASINSMMTVIKETDTEGRWGERTIYLSKNKDMLTGFSLNEKRLPDTVLRTPVQVSIDRDTQSAEVKIPRIIADTNLYQYGNNSMIRMIVTLGVASDRQYNPKLKEYVPLHKEADSYHVETSTPWFSIKDRIKAQTLKIAINSKAELMDCDTLVVGFGIEFGNQLSDTMVMPQKYSGCAKIVAAG